MDLCTATLAKWFISTVQPFSHQICSQEETLTLTTPNPPRGTLLEKFSTVGNWYFHLFKWGKITNPARSTGRKCWIWKINENFEDKGMFPKVHWRILEDSGRFLARIRGFKGTHVHRHVHIFTCIHIKINKKFTTYTVHMYCTCFFAVHCTVHLEHYCMLIFQHKINEAIQSLINHVQRVTHSWVSAGLELQSRILGYFGGKQISHEWPA